MPIDFYPRNEVRWLDPGPGVEFDGRGIAYSDAPLVWEPGPHPGEISVELWIRPSREPDDRLGQIFSFFDGDAVEPLLVAQWKSGLVIRNRVPERDAGRRYRELGSLGLAFRGHPLMLGLTSGPAGISLYLDGRETEHRSSIPIIDAEESFGGRLVLGNSASGTTPWHGELLGVAIYRRTLTAAELASHYAGAKARGIASLAGTAGLAALYPFDERSGESAESSATSGPRLQVPLAFRRLHMPILQSPNFRERSIDSYGSDVLLNFIAFTPLGFFLVAVLRRRDRPTVIAIVTFGFCISLAIELIQVQLPARVSSLADLLLNTLGTAFGVWLALYGPLAIRVVQDRPADPDDGAAKRSV